MKKLSQLNASQWSVQLCTVLDCLALIALGSTGDVHPGVFIACGVSFGLRFVPWFRLTTMVLGVGMILSMIAAAAAVILFHVPPVVAAAHVAPIAHAGLWLTDRPRALVPWRIGFGFVELILASALTTELYLYFLLVPFTLVATLAIACIFLEHELQDKDRRSFRAPLPPLYLRQMINQSAVLILSSLLIFPILPRMDANGDYHWSNNSQTGYTEHVSIENWKSISGQGQGSVALRIFNAENLSLLRLFWGGLIRGRVLDQFDGDSWSPIIRSHMAADSIRTQAVGPTLPRSTVKLEIVREALESPSLPMPYAVESIRLQGSREPLTRVNKGEVLLDQVTNQRVRYSVEFVPALRFVAAPKGTDEPTRTHLYVPTKLKSERMHRLVQRIFRPTMTLQERLEAIGRFFRSEKFSPVQDEQIDMTDGATSKNSLSPIENFLFVRKAGHCELFASATAVLLRMSGVPSRLVSGFRISRGEIGGVLSIRTGDAHAWVEYYDPRMGWSAYDPTPRESMGGNWLEKIRSTYEVMSGYFYKYVLAYGDENTSNATFEIKRWVNDFKQTAQTGPKNWEGQWLWLSAAIIAAFLIGIFAWALRSRFLTRQKNRPDRWNSWEGARELRRIRARGERAWARMQKKLAIQEGSKDVGSSGRSALLKAEVAHLKFRRHYEQARFGHPENFNLKEVKEALHEFESVSRNAETVFGSKRAAGG